MTGLLVLLAALGVPYLAMNILRQRRGRPWAFTFCQVAREWQESEYARIAARKAGRGGWPRP